MDNLSQRFKNNNLRIKFINGIHNFINKLNSVYSEIKEDYYLVFKNNHFINKNNSWEPKFIHFNFNNIIHKVASSTLTNSFILKPKSIDLKIENKNYNIEINIIHENDIFKLEELNLINNETMSSLSLIN